MYFFSFTGQPLLLFWDQRVVKNVAAYLLHDIVITNIVWCMAYKGRVGRMSYIAQKSRNSIAVVWVMRMGGGI